MKAIFFLGANFILQRRLRFFLTVFAAMASTCIVLWIVSGYEAVLKSHDVFAERALGRYTLSVDAISRSVDRHVMPQTLTDLRADPEVIAAEAMWAKRITIQTDEVVRMAPPPGSASDPEDMPAVARVHQGLMIAGDAPLPPFPILKGEWINSGRSAAVNGRYNAVVSAQIAGRYKLEIGSTLKIGRPGKTKVLEIIGVIDNPPMPVTGRLSGTIILPTPSVGGIYVSADDAEKITNDKFTITFIGLCLNKSADVHKFRFRWTPILNSYAQPAQFQRDHDLEEQLDEAASAKNMKLQSYAATIITMFFGFLMVFNTLNMGVSEQIREFAMLRAVALTRADVAMIIFIQAILVSGLGFGGGLGCAVIITKAASSFSMIALRHNVEIGMLSVILAAISTFGGALLAAVFPAWRSTRVRPLDAMTPPQAEVSDYTVLIKRLFVVSIAFIGLAALFIFMSPAQDGRIVFLRLISCVFCLGIGFILLAPPAASFVYVLIGGAIARIFRINPELLSKQLSSQLWRTVASILAMGVGLSLFISIQVWGYTLLENFVPGQWAPDALVTFGPDGLAETDALQVAKIPGIDPNHCLPILVEQPRLAKDYTNSARQASVIRQDNVVIVGLDPEKAIGSDHSTFNFSFVHGSRQYALAMLKQGNACIVPEHFLRVSGMEIGDTFTLIPPENPEHKAVYKIAASVKMKGWHWQTKSTGLRVRVHRAAALIFADYQSVAQNFSIDRPQHVWFNYTSDKVDPASVDDKLQSFYAGITGQSVVNGKPRNKAQFVIENFDQKEQPYIQTVTLRQIRHQIRTMAKRWLWAAGMLPAIAMLIGCIGLFNVIISSVQTRRWELGILRAVGFSRWTLVRMIIAEGVLIGVTAVLLSLGFGILAGWFGTTVAQHFSFFGGMKSELVLPWYQLGIGIIAALIFSALTAAIPAFQVGRTPPLTLLQQGRNIF
jgi:putative ABC transport system permease protein